MASSGSFDSNDVLEGSGGAGSANTKGALTMGEDWEAAFLVTKVASGLSAWRGKYQRIFAVTPVNVLNVDPSDWTITNSWSCSEIVGFAPSSESQTEFSITVNKGKKKNDVLKFVALDELSRSRLLCAVSKYSATNTNAQAFRAVKINRKNNRVDCTIEVHPYCLIVKNSEGRELSKYKFDEVERVMSVSDDKAAISVFAHGRPRMFASPQKGALVQSIALALTAVGLSKRLSEEIITTEHYRELKHHNLEPSSAVLAEFDVLKVTKKHINPKQRYLTVHESHLVERDAESYKPISARPLKTVYALVRHFKESQHFSLEYTDGCVRTYISSHRDEALAAITDGCYVAGNNHVDVMPISSKFALRLVSTNDPNDSSSENNVLKHVLKICKGKGPANAGGVSPIKWAAELMLANMPAQGLSGSKKSAMSNIIPPLMSHISTVVGRGSADSDAVMIFLKALRLCVSTQNGFKVFVQQSDATRLMHQCLQHADEGVVFCSLELLLRLINSQRKQKDDEESEVTAKKLMLTNDMRVILIELLDSHVAAAHEAGITSKAGSLVVMGLMRVLDSSLISRVDTTQQQAADHLMQLVASRYSAMLTLFRSKCPSIVESATMLVRGIVFRADQDTVRAMQSAALSTGVLLRHIYNGIFSASSDQRFISRYVVELWSTGNPTAHDLFRHMLPSGLLVYLDMPPLSEEEQKQLESLEANTSQTQGLAVRLRQRLQDADKAEKNKHIRRLNALEDDQPGAKRFGSKKKENAAQKAREAGRAAAAEAAVAAQAEMAKSKLELEKGENYSIFFHMITQDHNLPDLIWNQQTRGELRAALEAELKEIETEIDLGGKSARPHQQSGNGAGAKEGDKRRPSSKPSVDDEEEGDGEEGEETDEEGKADEEKENSYNLKVQLRFAWNHAEFEVDYPSLSQELKVGDQYLRLFLSSGEASVHSLRDPVKFFDSLYKRALRETAPNLKCLCLKGMTRVYKIWHKKIGPFEDTDYMVWTLAQTMNNSVRDNLIQLVDVLTTHPLNSEKLLNSDSLELFVDLLSTAHMEPPEKRTTKTLEKGGGLLLRDAPSSVGQEGGEDDNNQETLDPSENVKIWFYTASPKDLKPGEKPEKGPYSIQEMRSIGQMNVLKPSSMVWARGMREWVRLDSLRPLMWFVLSEGEPVLSPSERGIYCAEILLTLVKLRPSVDTEGNPVRPVPRAKRVLGSARSLPHIAQAMLCGNSKLVEQAAQLISEIVTHNPRAMVKLYLTGVFYFVMVYNGSNLKTLAKLLEETHLEQSFHHEASTIGKESTMARRSILGPMLPESLICVLANYGHEQFTKYFLDNVNNPEVIWSYSMRCHLVDMVTQHLGDLQTRLSANPSTIYDYCPIPNVVYEELNGEHWCCNYYLNNLTDEKRFPDWKIRNPVELLRAVLDSWKAELEKGEEEQGDSLDAYEVLAIPEDADDKTIRTAYRKMAMKYHPDKNPSGRETFEKVQKAYEMLTSKRPEAVSGPDHFAIYLFIRTQVILFKRYTKTLGEYKFAGYPLLLMVLNSAEQSTVGERAQTFAAASEAVYLTCKAAPRNADELVREDGVETLLRMISRLTTEVDVNAEPEEGRSGMGGTEIVVKGSTMGSQRELRTTSLEQRAGLESLEHILHTMSGLATLTASRERLENALSGPLSSWPHKLSLCLRYQHAPKVMQFALDSISRMCVSSALQDALVRSGVIFKLVPLLFRFDQTYDEKEEDGESFGAQKAANMQAKLAARALGRLAGMLLDKALQTPKNTECQEALNALLTPSLARRLGRTQPDALLITLNSHEESPTVMWNAQMRDELLKFCRSQSSTADQQGSLSLADAVKFRFKCLQDELRLGDIYVRFFVQEPDMTIDNPFGLVRELSQFIALNPLCAGLEPSPFPREKWDSDDELKFEEWADLPKETALKHLRLSLRALHAATVHFSGVEDELSGESAKYFPTLFELLSKSNQSASDSEEQKAIAQQFAKSSAAGSGLSAGAGGARSTAASATASIRELALSVISSISVHEPCARAIVHHHLVPQLIRELPQEPNGIGPILRTLCAHRCVVKELGRIGAIIDLLMLFAGGTAKGAAPGKKGGVSEAQAAQVTVDIQTRREAGALLSHMCSDSHHGPENLMNLKQLVPEALAISIKESLSNATSSGSSSAVGASGSGTGAASAGAGGSSVLGDAVEKFDGDHETPELIWDITCRHELRVALGQLSSGLESYRKKTAAAKKVSKDSVGWKLPNDFRVKYSVAEGELRVGGIFVRIFLKEPTYPLRDPKGFLDACLRRFVQEANHLCGMTSENARRKEEAAKAAREEALAEYNSGGTRLQGEGENALIVRGEDVMTQVTHAIVCLLRVRENMMQYVSALGHMPKIVDFLRESIGNKARYNLSVQSIRLLEVVASDKTCVHALQGTKVISLLFRTLDPLPKDAAFTLETIHKLIETDANSSEYHEFAKEALSGDAVTFLINLLENEDISQLQDPSGTKVHAIAILKLLENDSIHAEKAARQLETKSSSWDRYKHQKHDLFITNSQSQDYFLTDVEKGPSLLLKNRAQGGNSQPALLTDTEEPPPPPSQAPSASTATFGGFQPPAPAPAPPPPSFGGFQPPAPARTDLGDTTKESTDDFFSGNAPGSGGNSSTARQSSKGNAPLNDPFSSGSVAAHGKTGGHQPNSADVFGEFSGNASSSDIFAGVGSSHATTGAHHHKRNHQRSKGKHADSDDLLGGGSSQKGTSTDLADPFADLLGEQAGHQSHQSNSKKEESADDIFAGLTKKTPDRQNKKKVSHDPFADLMGED
eukprot:gb/GECG01006793.1/.p1 GENE.gb/GECG01006793.1/~~gb/GECG01006793.1/.p1  ORF type:complete len:2790 (+),score=366.62 gb/GECG01006793.1/:1-8370(+)